MRTTPRALAAFLVLVVLAAPALPPGVFAAFGDAAASGSSTYYEERAHALGIAWRHAGNDGMGDFRSVTGSGVCWGDFDGDGYEDLYFVNTLYDDAETNAERDPHAGLFRNDGDGRFTEIDEETAAAYRGWGNGCAVADYDGDGRLDIFVAGWGENTLYRNLGDFRFENVTAAAGLSTADRCDLDYGCWGQMGAFGDANGDGCLDLYVANYVRYDPANPNGNGPGGYDGQENFYFESDCAGGFVDLTDEAGLGGEPSSTTDKSLQVEWGDYNGDGLQDIIVANDVSPMMLFRNNGDGTFTDVAEEAGINDPRANMGVAFDDVNADGHLDVYITHYVGELNGFYLNDGDGTFTERSGEHGLARDRDGVGWGTGFIDFDNDGFSDIYVVNGHTAAQGGYNQSRMMFRNDGSNDRWTDVSTSVGPGFTMGSIGRGSAVADYLLDGRLTIAVSNTGDQDVNLLVPRNVPNNWLGLELRASGRDRFAVGAVITVQPEGLPPVTQVLRSGTSYNSQDGFLKHFGLGAAPHADVTVRWPDGTVQSWPDLGANQVLRLVQGSSVPVRDTLAPRTTHSTSETALRGWFQGDVTLTLEATDLGATEVSGLAATTWRVDGGAWQTGLAPITLSGFTSGEHVVEFRSVDAVGNEEPVRRVTINVDSERPSTVATAVDFVNGWAAPGSRLALHAADPTSGVFALYHRVGGGDLRTYDQPLSFSGEGPQVVQYFAEDRAGLVEDSHVLTVRVDTVPPTSSLLHRGPLAAIRDRETITPETRFSLAVADRGSGPALAEYRLDDGPWTPFPEGGLAISGADGERKLGFRGRDRAGNVEAEQSRVFVLDGVTPPPIAVTRPQGWTLSAFNVGAGASFLDPLVGPVAGSVGWTHPTATVGPITFQAEAGEDISGVAGMRIAIDGRTVATSESDWISYAWEPWSERAGWHRVDFAATDGLGNEGVVTRYVLVGPATFDGVVATATEGALLPPGAGPRESP